MQAWNDFVLDEWCATDPARLIPLSILPLWDPQLCADEIRRTSARGARAVTFSENPAALGLPSFWSDQLGLRLQFAGSPGPWARVELDGDGDRFAATYLDAGGRRVAGLFANRPADFAHLRQVLGHFSAGLVNVLERCAGKFDLTTRLQRHTAFALLRKRDDVLALVHTLPAKARHAIQERLNAFRAFIWKG